MQEAMQQFKKDYAASTPSAYVSYKEFRAIKSLMLGLG